MYPVLNPSFQYPLYYMLFEGRVGLAVSNENLFL